MHQRRVQPGRALRAERGDQPGLRLAGDRRLGEDDDRGPCAGNAMLVLRPIGARKRRRVGTEKIGEPEPPHQRDRAPCAAPLPAAGRRGNRPGKAERRRDALQGARERDVFHERLPGKTARGIEGLARGEDRLVAGGDPGQARTPVHHETDEGEEPRRARDAHIEAAPAAAPPQGLAAPRSRRESGSAQSACRKRRTSPVAARAPAFICAARPRCEAITLSASGAASAARVVAAAAIDDDHLDTALAHGGQPRERRGDAGRFVQRGNDDGEALHPDIVNAGWRGATRSRRRSGSSRTRGTRPRASVRARVPGPPACRRAGRRTLAIACLTDVRSPCGPW